MANDELLVISKSTIGEAMTLLKDLLMVSEGNREKISGLIEHLDSLKTFDEYYENRLDTIIFPTE